MNLNHDLLNNVNRKHISTACFQLLTKMQNEPPHIQIAATCCMFLLLCESFNQEPADIFRMSKNALAYDQQGDSEEHFAAVRDYIKGELK